MFNKLKTLRKNVENAIREKISGDTARVEAARTPRARPAPAPSTPSAASWDDDGVIPTPDEPRMLMLYKDDECDYCVAVSNAIERLGILVPNRDIRKEPRARADLWDVTHKMTTPCLFIDDVPLHESERIIAWLEAFAETMG